MIFELVLPAVFFRRICFSCCLVDLDNWQKTENSINMSEDRNYSNPQHPCQIPLSCLTRKPRCSRSPRIFPASTPGPGVPRRGLRDAGSAVAIAGPVGPGSRARAAAGAGRRQQCGAARDRAGTGGAGALPGVRLLEARADAWLVEAAGGENWHGFVSACVEQGWDGLENLALIPGTVGRRRCRTSAPMASSWTSAFTA